MIYGVVLLAMLGVMLAVAIRQARKVKTSADFLVAGRRLSVPILVATLLCSWIGAGSLFAGAEFAFEEGLASLWLPAGGWAGLAVIYFLAGRARKFAQFTIPDLLETRYGTGARVMGTLCIIVSYTAIVSYQFKAGGRILQLAFGIGEERGMLIVAGFVIAFTAMAGMSSVAYVDLVVGRWLRALPGNVSRPARLGGRMERSSDLAPGKPLPLCSGRWGLSEVVGLLPSPSSCCCSATRTCIRNFSARSERDARLSVMGWIAGTLFLETAIVLLAIVGGTLSRESIEQGLLPSWGIIPYAARHGSFPGSELFSWGAVFAKVISTGNNYLFSPTTNVVHDIYRRFINRQANDRTMLAALKGHGSCVGLSGVPAGISSLRYWKPQFTLMMFMEPESRRSSWRPFSGNAPRPPVGWPRSCRHLCIGAWKILAAFGPRRNRRPLCLRHWAGGPGISR